MQMSCVCVCAVVVQQVAAKVVVDHVIATDLVIVADTDRDLDHGAVIIATDPRLHTEDDHHHHTNAKEDLALES